MMLSACCNEGEVLASAEDHLASPVKLLGVFEDLL